MERMCDDYRFDEQHACTAGGRSRGCNGRGMRGGDKIQRVRSTASRSIASRKGEDMFTEASRTETQKNVGTKNKQTSDLHGIRGAKTAQQHNTPPTT